MLKSILEYLPLILFVLTTKFYSDFATQLGWTAIGEHDGLRAATAILVVCAIIQAIVYHFKGWKFSSMQKWSICSVVVLGLFSLLFANPMIIKLKPTVLFGLFSLFGFIWAKWKGMNWVEKMYREAFAAQNDIALPDTDHPMWQQALNYATVFFMLLAALNLLVAYNFTDEQWASFKLFGLSGLTLIFFMWQGSTVLKHQISNKESA